MIDLNATAIVPEANADIEYVPPGSGTWVKGRWIEDVTAAVPLRVVLQPAGSNLRDAPEGVRNEAEFVLWTHYSIANDGRVIYGGNQYRVVGLWDRRSDGGYVKVAIGIIGRE